MCDNIDERHKTILPDYVWGDGDPEGVRQRAAEEMIKTAQAAKRFGVKVVNGFTGSQHLAPASTAFRRSCRGQIDERLQGLRQALQADPRRVREAAASICAGSAPDGDRVRHRQRRARARGGGEPPAFGFNYDPSHFGYQGVDYVEVHPQVSRPDLPRPHEGRGLERHGDRAPGCSAGHVDFHKPNRYWDFRSLGRGNINFEEIIRALNDIGYAGPLSVEWEDGGMDREFGADRKLRVRASASTSRHRTSSSTPSSIKRSRG